MAKRERFHGIGYGHEGHVVGAAEREPLQEEGGH